MKTAVQALVTRFKGEVTEVQPIKDMYTETSVVFKPHTPEYEYMKKHAKTFSGDCWVRDRYFKPALQSNEVFNISGEAKDVSFSVGDDLTVWIETMTVDWKKD